MQIPVCMHQSITSIDLNTELGREANPTEELQKAPKELCYIHRGAACTLGTFIENK